MWFLPKCDNICIVNPLNRKFTLELESRKEHDEYMKKQQKWLAERIAMQNICYMVGI